MKAIEMKKQKRWRCILNEPGKFIVFIVLIISGLFNSNISFAQTRKLPSPRDLKKLSIEELMDIEVTSVSKNPEKLTEVASAIQVLTGEDIRRSTSTRLPEALRLAPNLQVAQYTSHDWSITSRGFNGAPLTGISLANKLLVMIDGRSVYEPLIGGVFWDVQNVMMDDIDRIEIVSGPGGTLWGANAVNGVINVISKSSRETQGLVASVTGGNIIKDQISARYGSHIDSTFFFRVYGQRLDQRNTYLTNGNSNRDSWEMTQGGFRSDYIPSDKNSFTLQGDIYDNRENDTLNVFIKGMNLLGRWNHNISEESNISLQIYYDRIKRTSPASAFTDELNNYDLDFQHSFRLSTRHFAVWGLGYRVMDNKTSSTPALSFDPANRTFNLFNAFFQDQVDLIPEKLSLTLGTKLLHNDYTKFEFQPSIRLAWFPKEFHTIWASISRAVRTPGRFEVDEITPVIITPGKKFTSEKVLAYEIGYRHRITEKVSFSLAGYYNFYRDLRSIDLNSAPPPAIIFANNQKAEAWGFEISGNYVISEKWRFRGGYTFLDKKFTSVSPAVLPTSYLVEGLDPQHQVMIQSILDLPANFQFDFLIRYVDILPKYSTYGSIPSYYTINARIAWEYKNLTLMIAGQHLLHNRHREFGATEIPKNIYGKITVRF